MADLVRPSLSDHARDLAVTQLMVPTPSFQTQGEAFLIIRFLSLGPWAAVKTLLYFQGICVMLESRVPCLTPVGVRATREGVERRLRLPG